MNSRKITQRELRNQSGEILRAVGRAETFVITRGGVDVGVLAPLPGRRYVAKETFLAALAGAAPPDGARFRADLDAVVDQETTNLSNPAGSRGMLDTSVVIALEHLDPQTLPQEAANSAVTLAELAAGPHAASDGANGRGQDRLQRVEATFAPISVDANVVRAYGRIYAALAAAGRMARGRRAFDLPIAATALSEGLPLYRANPDDFTGVAGLVKVVPVRLPPAR